MALQIIPKGFWSTSFRVRADDRLLAEVKDDWLRSFRGEWRLGDETYLARRERGVCRIESAGTVLAEARRPRRFQRTLQFEHGGRAYTLCARSSMGRAFDLLDGDQTVGSICPVSIFSRRATADLPATLPPWLQVFVIWLVMSSWKETDTVGVMAGVGAAAASG